MRALVLVVVACGGGSSPPPAQDGDPGRDAGDPPIIDAPEPDAPDAPDPSFLLASVTDVTLLAEDVDEILVAATRVNGHTAAIELTSTGLGVTLGTTEILAGESSVTARVFGDRLVAGDVDFVIHGRSRSPDILADAPTIRAHHLGGRFGLDTTFGAAGLVQTAFPGVTILNGAIAVNNGKLVVAGRGNDGTVEGILVGRLNSDGTPDTTFAGGDGYTIGTATATTVNVVLVDPSGRIVAGGGAAGGNFVARFTAAGDLDTTFAGGVVTNASFEVGALATQSAGGKLLVGAGGVIQRLNDDGTLDTTFGNAGNATTGAGTGAIRTLVVQEDGKPLAGASASGAFTVARFSADGVLDATFGTNGKTTLPTHFQDGGLVRLSDGKVLVASAGALPPSGPRPLSLSRLLSDGTLDAAFGTAGQREVALIGNCVRVINGPGDTMYVASRSSNRSRLMLARVTADGALDPAFGHEGELVTGIDLSVGGGPLALALQADGKPVVTGILNAFVIARYAP